MVLSDYLWKGGAWLARRLIDALVADIAIEQRDQRNLAAADSESRKSAGLEAVFPGAQGGEHFGLALQGR